MRKIHKIYVQHVPSNNAFIVRIFDEIGDGFISVEKFKFILKEIDEDFTDEELEEVILEVHIY